MKKREQGSVSEDRKCKSLKQRWFALKGDKAGTNKAGEEKNCVEPQGKAIIAQDVVVSLEGGDHSVMGMFSKQCNKCVSSWSNKMRRNCKMHKLEEGDTEDICKQVAIGDVKSVKGKLQLV